MKRSCSSSQLHAQDESTVQTNPPRSSMVGKEYSREEGSPVWPGLASAPPPGHQPLLEAIAQEGGKRYPQTGARQG